MVGGWNQMILEGPLPAKPFCDGVSLMGLVPRRYRDPVLLSDLLALRREQTCDSL